MFEFIWIAKVRVTLYHLKHLYTYIHRRTCWKRDCTFYACDWLKLIPKCSWKAFISSKQIKATMSPRTICYILKFQNIIDSRNELLLLNRIRWQPFPNEFIGIGTHMARRFLPNFIYLYLSVCACMRVSVWEMDGTSNGKTTPTKE